MNNWLVRRGGSDDAANLAIEGSLLRGEGASDGSSHRDLDREDDPVRGRLDDPAEPAQRHIALF